MTDTPAGATQIVSVAPPARTTWKDWLPVISLMLVICALLVTGGRTMAQIADNTRRLEVLERRADQRDDQLNNLQARAAGMDAKLDLILGHLKDAER